MLLLLSSCPCTDPELLWVELDKGKSFAAPVTGCRWQLLKGQVVLACWVEVLLHMRHRNPGAFSQRLSHLQGSRTRCLVWTVLKDPLAAAARAHLVPDGLPEAGTWPGEVLGLFSDGL